MRVSPEKVDDVAEVDIGGVAERDEMAEPDILAVRPVEDHGAERARLADEGNAALFRAGMGEAGIEADAGYEQADAVRAKHAQQIRSCRIEHRLLQGAAVDKLAPGQAGGDDDCRARAAPAE